MERKECPECGNKTYNEVCDLCGNRIPNVEDMTERTQTETGWKWNTPQIKNYGRLYVFRKSKTVWAILLVLFVLIPLLIVGTEMASRTEMFRYDKAGWGEAKLLPKIESQILYRGHGITVKAKSFGMLDGEQTLAVTVVNRSGKDIDSKFTSVAVNGCMISGTYRYLDVEKGKTERVYLKLNPQELSDMNIDTVKEISLELAVYENEGISPIIPRQSVELKTSAYGLE